MKRLLPLILASALLAGCTTSTSPSWPVTVSRDSQASTWPLLANKESKYSFSFDMTQPKTTEMGNWKSILNGFTDLWTNTYTPTSEDLDFYVSPQGKEECSWGIDLMNQHSQKIKTVSYAQFVKKDAKISYTGYYEWTGIGLALSEDQKTKFSNQGWLITQANSWFLASLQKTNPYQNEEMWLYPSEERVNGLSQIGGSPIPYQRYPYNTLLVTSDLVLHLYHKIFDNALKSYEETKARPVMQVFASNMLNKFDQLAKKEKNPDLKRQYDFLTAYWMIPTILLIPQDTILSELGAGTQWYDGSEDLTDTQIHDMIINKTKSLIWTYKPTYASEIEQSIQTILSGTDTEKTDLLLSGFVGPFDPSFDIKQDYTQFVPRAHYTESSLLKTYFMGMKWLMREKLYFSQADLAKASLIMNQNIAEKELTGVNVLQDFVKKVVGQDDDVNVSDIKWFISSNKWKSDLQILSGLTISGQEELTKLRPQKIISTHYTTPEEWSETEASAKDKTAGFVFFWEKFTIDSWVFDQITAGSAEKESVKKPPVQSALAIADILIGTNRTFELMKQWFTSNSAQFELKQTQVDAYPEVKKQTADQIVWLFSTGTVYGQRMDLLAWTMKEPEKAPYFMQQTGYQDKNINTFLGNYTELKHDTLLYTKQAFAEMGAGGWGDCSIFVYPPELPVPRGYVEPNIDLFDSLLALTKTTSTYFDDESYQKFTDYLTFLRKLAVSESKNDKISNEDFESLRLSYNDLYGMVQEKKLIGNPSTKNARGGIIADIFTSGKFGPLYIATGRPALMLLMVNDVNGARVVRGPVYSTYEFYGKPFPMTSGRYSDEDWQQAYDDLTGQSLYSLPFAHLLEPSK